MTKPAFAVALSFFIFGAVACGGSDKKTAAPAAPAEPVTPAASAVLTVAPFVLTITGTKQDGTKQVQVIRGSADGVISAERDGQSREVVRVSADGTFTPLVEGRSDVVKLGADGTLSMNGETLPRARVGDDGTIYRDDKPILKIEDGKVVDLAGDLLVSRVTMNGKVAAETRFEMTVEGGDEVRKLVAAILILQMAGGKAVPADQSSATTEVEAVPEPTKP